MIDINHFGEFHDNLYYSNLLGILNIKFNIEHLFIPTIQDQIFILVKVS